MTERAQSETSSHTPDGTPATAAHDAPDAARTNHLRTLVRGALDQYFVYPTLARKHGWQGQVGVELRLDPEGRLQGLRVVRSSGYPILDQDALETLRRIATIPQARQWLRGRSWELELPVIYRLVEG